MRHLMTAASVAALLCGWTTPGRALMGVPQPPTTQRCADLEASGYTAHAGDWADLWACTLPYRKIDLLERGVPADLVEDFAALSWEAMRRLDSGYYDLGRTFGVVAQLEADAVRFAKHRPGTHVLPVPPEWHATELRMPQ
jgi:hypothetical protein